jgi:hypothetical protein
VTASRASLYVTPILTIFGQWVIEDAGFPQGFAASQAFALNFF